MGDAVAVGTPLGSSHRQDWLHTERLLLRQLSPFEVLSTGCHLHASPTRCYGSPQLLDIRHYTSPVLSSVLWNLIVFAIVWRLREKFKPRRHSFLLFPLPFAAGDFGIRFLRTGEPWILGASASPGARLGHIGDISALAYRQNAPISETGFSG
jgi:hypothetical protein